MRAPAAGLQKLPSGPPPGIVDLNGETGLDSLEPQDLRQLAGELGLEQAYELSPQAFAAALAKARALSAAAVPVKSFADEPAHVLILPDCSKASLEGPDGG